MTAETAQENDHSRSIIAHVQQDQHNISMATEKENIINGRVKA